MLKGFIKNLIVSNVGTLVEDFTAQDIVIDQWNGRIAKENVKFKKDALRGLLANMFGAPVEIVQGYAKQLLIEVPWSKILSKPVEVKIEDVHLILKSRGSYDRQFVKERIIAAKQSKIQELLNQIKDQIETDLKLKAQQEATQSYISRLTSMIEENLRISVRNIHIRFEDTKVSRCDSAFNFGLMAESITYSMTNNRFQRAFLNIDDKIQEQKSFSMLQITKLAMYWNSNAQENWTKNPEFCSLNAQGTINFSKRYTENLIRNHFASKQDGQHSNVFIIQPCDICLKFRTNLAPGERPEIPTSTTAMDISDITVSLDEEVYKDIQFLGKFFSWHSESKKKTAYLKYRPSYTTPVKGNAQAWWGYAIRATVYLIRKNKVDKTAQKRKRHEEMVQLAEILRMEKINTYLKEAGSKELLLTLSDGVPLLNGIKTYRSENKLLARKFHLQYKLTPEQIVVAISKADKEAKIFIAEHQAKSSLTGWVTSMFKWSHEETKQQLDPSDQEFQLQLDKIVEKSDQLQRVQVSGQNEYKKDKQVSSHFSLSIPLIELLIVNKQLGSYNSSKCFMQIALQDFFFQSVGYADGHIQALYALRNFQIVDKLVANERFQKVVFMAPSARPSKKSGKTQERKNSLNTSMFSLESGSVNNAHEIEEEDRPFINNGLPKIRSFQDSVKKINESFLVFQVVKNPIVDEEGLVDKIKIDLFVNHTSLFYNRAMISQAQTFFHRATVNQVQNASAEFDFENRKQQLFQQTEQQLQVMLRQSHIELGCTLHGLDVLVPDDMNFEQSKFILLQTGNVILRSKPLQDLADKGEAPPIDPHFSIILDKTVQKLSSKQPSDEVQQFSSGQMAIVQCLQRRKAKSSWDEYVANCYDFRVLYVPTSKELETVFSKEMETSQNQVERQYSILRKTDISADFSSFKSEGSVNGQLMKACFSMTQLDLRFTNKEVKELKYFADKFQKYHDELRDQVFQQYVRIVKESQAIIKKVKTMPQLKQPLSNSLINISQAGGIFANHSTHNLLAKSTLGLTRKRTVSGSSNASNGTHDDFQDALANFSDARSQVSRPRLTVGSDSDEDGFYDAQDFFDPEILNMLKLDKNMETITEESKFEKPEVLAKEKSNLSFYVQAQINKISVQVLESQDFRAEIVKNLKNVMTQRVGSEERQSSSQWMHLKDDVKNISENLKSRYYIELKIKQKGTPFLSFEVSKLSAALLHLPACEDSAPKTDIASLIIRDVCLTNKQPSHTQVILRSANHIIDDQVRFSEAGFDDMRKNSLDFSMRSEASYKKKPPMPGGRLFDLEDEDNMHLVEDEDLQDNFMSFCLLSQNSKRLVDAESSDDELEEAKVLQHQKFLSAKVELGLLEAEITDYTIKKIIETLVTDFPVSPARPKVDDFTNKAGTEEEAKKGSCLETVLTDMLVVSDGLHCKLRLQQSEISHLKVIGLQAHLREKDQSVRSSLRLEDFQILHEDNELVFRHNFDTQQSKSASRSSHKSAREVKPNEKMLNFFEFQTFDFSAIAADSPQILTVEILSKANQTNISCNVSNLLVITDLQTTTKIVQNLNGLLLALGPFKSNLLGMTADDDLNKVAQQGGGTAVNLCVSGFHFQVPVSRDSKNFLFLSLDSFTFDKRLKEKSGDLVLKTTFNGLECFVAKQIDQLHKYYLIQVLDLDLQAYLPPEDPNLPKELTANIGKVQFNINDNFLLLLASMVEYHTQDLISIQSALANLIGLLKVAQPRVAHSARPMPDTPRKKVFMSRKSLRQYAKVSPFVKSVIAQEKVLRNDEVLSLRNYCRVTVGCIQIQWIFDMSFDDHVENFQTLNNRNFSKQVLSRLETKQETLIMPQFNYGSDPDSPLLKKPEKLGTGNKRQNLSFNSYKRLAFTLHDVLFESAQNQGPEMNQYLNLTVNTAILDHHQTELNNSVKHHAGTVYVSQYDPSIVSEFPIVIFRSIQNDGQPPSQNSKSQGEQVSELKQRYKEPDAIIIGSAFNKLQGNISLVDIRCCQMNAKVLANLVTSVYSCKNLLQHGQKRHLMRSVLKNISGSENIRQANKPKLDFVIGLKKTRFIFFDSLNQSDTKKAKSNRDSSLARTLQDYETSEQIQFKPNSLLIAECAFQINNQLPLLAEEDAELQPNTQLNVQALGLEVYMNSARTNLIDLLVQGSENRAVILYPTEMVLESQFFENRNLRINDVQVSMIEFETSFRQLFNLNLLMNKLSHELEPIKYIFARINTATDSKVSQERVGQQRSKSQARRSSLRRSRVPVEEKSREARKDVNFVKESQKESQRGVMILAVKVSSIYIALIREAGYLPLGGSRSVPLLPNEMNCLPLLSLEIKWVRMESKFQVTGLQQTDIQLPFELYYFNQKLAFFEPAIEKVLLKASIDSDLKGNSEQRLVVENVLNVNFSVALYESLFLLNENFQEEKKAYDKARQKEAEDYLPDQLREIGHSRPELLLRQKTEADQLVYSTSTFFIRNKTGEMLLFKAGRQPVFTEMQNNETLPLDFNTQPSEDTHTHLINVETGSKGLFDGIASSDMQPSSEFVSNLNSEDLDETDSDMQAMEEMDQDQQQLQMEDQRVFKVQKTRSMYRRGKFRLKKSEPNIVLLQVLIQQGKELTRTESFEINFNLLSCQRVFLDDNRRLYVICQIQNKDGQKILVVRSPMQVTNNLQIPIEVQLCIPHKREDDSDQSQLANPIEEASSEDDRAQYFRSLANPLIGLEVVNFEERMKNFQAQPKPKPETAIKYTILVKAESSVIIPLKACSFESVQIRPIIQDNPQPYAKDVSQFEWSEEAQICLLQEESDIFETKPVILSSQLAGQKKQQDSQMDAWKSKQRSNINHVFFALNANTYSIRSFIDFNTQKTEFISLRYLSVTAPFVFENLIPVPITMLFKNVSHNLPTEQLQDDSTGIYDLTLKHNSALQVLYLNPQGNFEFSLAIPGFNHSTYARFRVVDGDNSEYKSFDVENADIKLKSFGSRQTNAPELDSDSDVECNKEMAQLAQRTPFRFLRQRKLLFEMHSQFQNQFNICGNIALIQGFYQVSFYSKFWLLNNTQMPLQFRVTHNTQSFPPLDLPFQSNEFDFETSKHFANAEVAPKSINDKRKDSGETLRESRTELQEDTQSEYPVTEKESVSYIRKQICTMVAEEKRASDQEILLRLKPWESYRAQGRDTDGLMAALTQEDISRVSSIYFTQEMLAEETKDEIEQSPQKLLNLGSLISTDRSNIKPKQNETSESQVYITAAGEPSSSQRPGFSNVSSHQQSKNLLSASDVDVAKKRTVQFQEGSIIIEGSLASSHNPAWNQGVTRSMQSVDASRFDTFERLTKTSKTSIQLQNFSNNPDAKQAKPLNPLRVSRVELYEAPLHDKDQLKRVILFSDTEDSLTDSQIQQQLYKQTEIGDQGNFLLGSGQQQNLKLKVCDSEWATIPFDLARLHTGPIQIIDSEHLPGSNRPRAMFELVAVVTFLPSPFSFSKLICFQPRYMMVNRTFHTIQVVQAQCEELGTFKIFPQETSVFHWTDCNKSQQISVKMADFEFSGSIEIDKIGEWNLRLKSSYGLAENIILNVSISEEQNSLYIVFTDIQHAPPYRIENLTKSRFNIAQAGCRLDDFDRLEPYSTRSFAWSCPLQKKELRISLCNLQSDEDLGKFYIDSIQERELIKIRDRERKKQFILEITSEKTMKVLRIMYPHMLNMQKEQEKGIAGDANVNFASQKLIIERLGISIVNSQARELSYTTISNLRFSHESTAKHQKLSLRVGDVQMDNQVSRQYDAIIFKRQERDRNRGDFFCLKFNLEKNLTIENLIVFKYIIIAIVPFNIMIDGTFCDEMFLYSKDVISLVKRYTFRKKHLEVDYEQQHSLLNPEGRKHKGFLDKEGALDLKKKGQPIVEQRDMQKIYIENFLIGEINFSVTFSKRPVVFREFTMPPLIKFLISMLSGLSKVQLSFNKYHVQHEHMLVSIFLARLNQFYKNEFVNHKQLLNLFSQMGIFTPVYEAVTTLWNATKAIVFSPLQERPDEENMVKAIFLDSFVFVKDYFQQLSGSVFDSIISLKSGVVFIANHYGGPNEIGELTDEDRVVQNVGSPLNAIETQNQLWLKVIIREIQSTDGKKRKLRKQNNKEQTEERKHTRRVLDVREKAVSTVSNITTLATSAALKVANLPTKIKQAYSGVVTTFITGTKDNNGQLQKVRPPRFVGFTMELEPYSKKKAFVLQILNDINLNVFEAETIQKMYNLNNHVVIVTGKRIICVDEQRCITKDPSSGAGFFAKVRNKKGNQNVFSNSIAYRHWNILFKDIYRVSLDMLNRETGKFLQKAELERVFMENHSLDGDDDSQSQDRRNQLLERNLMFVLRIHYQMEIDEEFLMFDDGTVSLAPTRNQDNPDLMASVHEGLTGFQKKMFGDKRKKNYEMLGKGRAKGGLMDGLSGLMVGRKDIQAKLKDFKVIKRIHRDVENKLALDRKKRSQQGQDEMSNQSLI